MATSVFIPHEDIEESDETADEVMNPDPFFPSLSIREFRLLMRNDDVVTEARLGHFLLTAAVFINDLLANYKKALTEKEVDTLPSENEKQLYKIAVFHRAKTYILESYRDIDTTGDGEQRAESYESRIAFEQQREREAIRLLIGKKRTTITLI